MQNFLAAMIGYMCGSIPFGLILSQLAGLGDIRKIGSGNIGATNVLRTGNKKIAALTLLCDVLKGLAPVLIGRWLNGNIGAEIGGFASLAGHIFPIWLGFKGGKGVATALGVMLGWSWPVALISLAAWIIVFFAKQISSLSALIAALVSIPTSYFINIDIWPATTILAAIIWITHRANIQRLLKSEEPKTSFSKKS
jgi:acyl phosphate:glycerol-3-phosphate acyltransferase